MGTIKMTINAVKIMLSLADLVQLLKGKKCLIYDRGIN